MRADSAKKRCPVLWYPKTYVALQLLVMEEVLSLDPTRESRHDFPCGRPGRTTFVLIYGSIDF